MNRHHDPNPFDEEEVEVNPFSVIFHPTFEALIILRSPDLYYIFRVLYMFIFLLLILM